MSSIRTKGLYLGMLVGLAWGLDTVLLGAMMAESPVFVDASARALLLMAFLHDAFGFAWLALLLLCKREWPSTGRILFEKWGLATVVAAIVGGPLGMSAFVLGITYAGPAYASSISVIYPGIGGVLAYLFLKERISRGAMVGIGVSIGGSVALGYSSVDLALHPYFSVGLLLAFGAAVGWASEGVMIAYAMRRARGHAPERMRPRQLLAVRFGTSLVIYALVIMPISGGYRQLMALTSVDVLAFAGISALGVTSYLAWYKAVQYVGAALGTALNSTSALWAIVFSWLLLDHEITVYLAVCGAVIVTGVCLFAFSQRAMAPANRRHR